jgi:hypothetical protein
MLPGTCCADKNLANNSLIVQSYQLPKWGWTYMALEIKNLYNRVDVGGLVFYLRNQVHIVMRYELDPCGSGPYQRDTCWCTIFTPLFNLRLIILTILLSYAALA